MKITLFETAFTSQGYPYETSGSFLQAYADLTGGYVFKDAPKAIKATMQAKTAKAIDQAKTKLPLIAWSAFFDTTAKKVCDKTGKLVPSKNMDATLAHTGFVAFDIDRNNEDAPADYTKAGEFIKALKASAVNWYAVHVTPSSGIRLIVFCDGLKSAAPFATKDDRDEAQERHDAFWREHKPYYEQAIASLGFADHYHVCPNAKDFSRLMFVFSGLIANPNQSRISLPLPDMEAIKAAKLEAEQAKQAKYAAYVSRPVDTNSCGQRYEWRDLDEVQKAEILLDLLPVHYADEQGEWVQVGMCLKSLGEVGFTLWQQFSSKSVKCADKGNDRKMRSHWNTFKGELTIASLYQWAIEDQQKTIKDAYDAAKSKGYLSEPPQYTYTIDTAKQVVPAKVLERINDFEIVPPMPSIAVLKPYLPAIIFQWIEHQPDDFSRGATFLALLAALSSLTKAKFLPTNTGEVKRCNMLTAITAATGGGKGVVSPVLTAMANLHSMTKESDELKDLKDEVAELEEKNEKVPKALLRKLESQDDPRHQVPFAINSLSVTAVKYFQILAEHKGFGFGYETEGSESIDWNNPGEHKAAIRKLHLAAGENEQAGYNSITSGNLFVKQANFACCYTMTTDAAQSSFFGATSTSAGLTNRFFILTKHDKGSGRQLRLSDKWNNGGETIDKLKLIDALSAYFELFSSQYYHADQQDDSTPARVPFQLLQAVESSPFFERILCYSESVNNAAETDTLRDEIRILRVHALLLHIIELGGYKTYDTYRKDHLAAVKQAIESPIASGTPADQALMLAAALVCRCAHDSKTIIGLHSTGKEQIKATKAGTSKAILTAYLVEHPELLDLSNGERLKALKQAMPALQFGDSTARNAANLAKEELK